MAVVTIVKIHVYSSEDYLGLFCLNLSFYILDNLHRLIKMTCCGLWMTHLGDSEESAPVPLTGVSVNVRIIDLAAVVKIEQVYENRESQSIEATYKFPLDEGSLIILKISLIFLFYNNLSLSTIFRSCCVPVHG